MYMYYNNYGHPLASAMPAVHQQTIFTDQADEAIVCRHYNIYRVERRWRWTADKYNGLSDLLVN